MNTLFSLEPTTPQGFVYYPDFINKEEEQALVAAIQTISFTTFTFQGYEAKRRVASFGYDWNFEERVLSKSKDIPPVFNWLIDRVAHQLAIQREAILELLVTEYPEGAVINWHRDAPPFDIIAGVSLESDCLFKLKPYEAKGQGRKAVITLPVKRRSLYILKDASRTDWQHSIAPVKQTRYSITLRTLKTPAY